jgi:hypothetical protein
MNTYLARTFAFCFILASAQARPLALVGGRLIDGFGGHPLANSVIIIENERVTSAPVSIQPLVGPTLIFRQ